MIFIKELQFFHSNIGMSLQKGGDTATFTVDRLIPINTPFPNLFAFTVSHKKTRSYLVNCK